jgi:4-amino-4-deoxy-L-arabinose transferase-like glycosyltransferase
MDGQQYACISKNLAHGLGTFWHPYLSATWFRDGSPYFLEQPPLVYGIQSLFFDVFGDSMYVERMYSLLTAILTAFIIVLIWKQINKDEQQLNIFTWLPVLLWIIIPVCYWSYQNDMQENTMGVFTLAAVYFSIKAMTAKGKTYLYLVISGIAIFMASLSKGLPGLFPVAVIAIYWLIFRNGSVWRMLWHTLLLVLVPAVIYLLLLQNRVANESIHFYFVHRVIERIRDEPTVDNRFYIIFRLCLELIPLLILTLAAYFFTRLKHLHLNLGGNRRKQILLFLLVGLSGSAPMMLTHIQNGFYFVPALPFFGIACALIIAPLIAKMMEGIDIKKKSFRIFKLCAIALLLFSIIYSASKFGKKGRDVDMLEDVYTIGKAIPAEETIGMDPKMLNEWSLHFYMMRYFDISLDIFNNVHHKYYLNEKGLNSPLLKSYKQIPLPTKRYDLYCLE